MLSRPLALVAGSLLVISGMRADSEEVGRQATRTRVTVIDVDGKSERVILDSPRRFESPSWSPDGTYLILNSGGKLWRVPADGSGPPREISTGSAGWIDTNHGISPDGKTLAMTLGPIALLPASGGEPRPIAAIPATSYFQAWAPDNKSVAYTSIRAGGVDIFAAPIEGGAERRLTSQAGVDDYPDFSPDGRQIYFNSDRSGSSDIWRMPAEGAGPGDARAERITSDGPEDWSPHPSPDGKWLIFLSYRKGTSSHPPDRDVAIRRVPLPIAAGAEVRPEEVVRFVGGHGSLGSRPWSPDGRRFAFARFEPPPPTIRVVFFTPNDLAVPPGVPRRLGKVAEAAERFLVEGMKRSGYGPSVEHPFRRGPDGSLEILYMKGDRPEASGIHSRPELAQDILRRATEQYGIAGDNHLWWIFVHLGPPPTHFSDWAGHGESRDGGWAIVNYSTAPGEIRPDLSLGAGFNDTWELKGTVHELGHCLGLPHIGPDPGLGLGNSLMGPNNSVYAGRRLPHADRVYLTSASAAMLWKHPIFSGESKDRAFQPSAKLAEFKGSYEKKADRLTMQGRVTSDRPPHSVVALDDRGRPGDEYWNRGISARVAADGTFRLTIERPAHLDGRLRLLFCFDNGMVLGDAEKVTSDDRGEIIKPYRFLEGQVRFPD